MSDNNTTTRFAFPLSVTVQSAVGKAPGPRPQKTLYETVGINLSAWTEAQAVAWLSAGIGKYISDKIAPSSDNSGHKGAALTAFKREAIRDFAELLEGSGFFPGRQPKEKGIKKARVAPIATLESIEAMQRAGQPFEDFEGWSIEQYDAHIAKVSARIHGNLLKASAEAKASAEPEEAPENNNSEDSEA